MAYLNLSADIDDVSGCDDADVISLDLLACVEVSMENDDVTGLCDDSDVI